MEQTFFSKNVKFLREIRNLKQVEMLENIGFSQTTWNNYEKGKSFPKFEDLITISKYFDVSESDLIHKKIFDSKILEKGETAEKEENGKKSSKIYSKISPKSEVSESIVVYGANTGNKAYNVYDLDSKAAAGVAAFIQDGDKGDVKPTIYMPNLGVGIHIRIKITGDSMHSTIKDGDYVIATYLTEPLKTLREGFIYVVLDKDDGIVCKRIYKQGKEALEFESDNDIYKPYNRHLNDVLGLFKVVEIHTRDLRNYYNDTRREITKLWSAVEAINKKLPNSIPKIKS